MISLNFQNGLDTIADLRFFHDHRHIALDRLFTYLQLSCNFFVRQSARGTVQHLCLASRKIVWSALVLVPAIQVAALQKSCRKLRRYIGLALADAFENANKFSPLHSLSNATAHP